MQTFLVTILTFISSALYGPEAKTERVETQTSIKKEVSKPQLEENTEELETC